MAVEDTKDVVMDRIGSSRECDVGVDMVVSGVGLEVMSCATVLIGNKVTRDSNGDGSKRMPAKYSGAISKCHHRRSAAPKTM